ncbi:MAG: energy transducer TonB [Rhodothermales bacterium]|nr:energy transducer TonB [Rhodothermales bacterium]MBO6779740.1 energy transducer TonB [Rhodothermales bacterium]
MNTASYKTEPPPRRSMDRREPRARSERTPSEHTQRGPAALPRVRGRRKITRSDKVNLSKNYRITFQLALIAAILVTIGLIRAPIGQETEALDYTLAQQEVVQMEEIQQTQQVERPPPPPRPPVPVEVPNDVILDDEVLDMDVSLDLDAPALVLPPPPAPPAAEVAEEVEPEIFVVVEEMPQIIGGAAKVYEHLEYPDIARQASVEGLSIIQFVVEPDGTPSNLTVARSASEVLDKAAMEAVAQLRFVPGKQRGKPVRVSMAIPIRFRLESRGTERPD